MTPLPLNRYLDHAVLTPGQTQQEIASQIRVGIAYQVYTVCVQPANIALAQKLCRGTDTKVSCVLAFPHGLTLSVSKADEAKRYVDLGVREIDMVVNYGLIRSGLWDLLRKDIASVTDVARVASVKVKAILETAALNDEQIAQATKIAMEAQAHFVKTSTGFGPGGATEQALRVMLDAAGGNIEVKASGGIRTYEQAKHFVEMGVTRLGVSQAGTLAICASSQSVGESSLPEVY